MIKAALIDMDGVLYDSMPLHARSWARLSRELGWDIDESEFYLYEGMTGEATLNLLSQKNNGVELEKEKCRELYARKTDYFRECGEAPLMEGAGETLNLLKDRGVRCILVTGSGQRSLIDKIENDYPGVFTGMITSRDVINGKPHPEPYLKGAAMAGASPSECIAIDNAPLGVESAAKAGVYTIGVTTGPIPAAKLRDAGADVVLDSMKCSSKFLDENLDKL